MTKISEMSKGGYKSGLKQSSRINVLSHGESSVTDLRGVKSIAN